MSGLPEHHPDAQLDTGPRSPETSVAVSPHHLASDAAISIMSAGGNAVDGAVALNAVLGVVAPDSCGPGGDLFALIHRDGDPAPSALNASGRAGSGADAAALRADGHDAIPERSPDTITVPGCVYGWDSLLRDRGTISMAEALAPAIDLAENGFPASLELSMSLERIEDLIAGQGSAPPLYPDGRPPAPNTVLRRPDLAATMRDLAEGGPQAFYSGRVGMEITAVTGGVITAEDLVENAADWVEPIKATAFGRTGWTIPPNSQGYVALAAAWAFDQLTDETDPRSPAFQHALIEAYRIFEAERDDIIADPDRAIVSNGDLLDPARLAGRIQGFNPEAATSWPTGIPNPGGTAFMCTRDGSGLSVSLIQSNYHGIGTGISAGDTGVFLQDRGGGFNLIPGHPNELAPRKRPFHTLSPTLWTTPEGRFAAVIGTRGGEFQPQYIAQAAALLFRTGLSPGETQAAPRWQVDKAGDGGHVVKLEPTFGPEMAHTLGRLGHKTETVDPWQPGWGPVSIIAAADGGISASADPRVSTATAASYSPE